MNDRILILRHCAAALVALMLVLLPGIARADLKGGDLPRLLACWDQNNANLKAEAARTGKHLYGSRGPIYGSSGQSTDYAYDRKFIEDQSANMIRFFPNLTTEVACKYQIHYYVDALNEHLQMEFEDTQNGTLQNYIMIAVAVALVVVALVFWPTSARKKRRAEATSAAQSMRERATNAETRIAAAKASGASGASLEDDYGIRDEYYKFHSLAEMKKKRARIVTIVFVSMIALSFLAIVVVGGMLSTRGTSHEITDEEGHQLGIILSVSALVVMVLIYFLVGAAIKKQKLIKAASGFMNLSETQRAAAQRAQQAKAAEWAQFNDRNQHIE